MTVADNSSMAAPAIGSPATGDSDTASSEPPQVLRLDLVVEGGDWPDAVSLERLLDDAARAVSASGVLSGASAVPSEACVAFSTDAAVLDLNARYRNKSQPTNVLSFVAPTPPVVLPGEPKFLGDIVLAVETVRGEAREQGIPIAHHIQHLVVHGVLHLLGFDHELDAEAEVMEAEERRILAALGVADPYSNND